jgi:hypothetical protein
VSHEATREHVLRLLEHVVDARLDVSYRPEITHRRILWGLAAMVALIIVGGFAVRAGLV